VWNKFTSDAITAEVAALVWGSALSCLRIIGFPPPVTNAIDSFFHPLSGLHVSFEVDFLRFFFLPVQIVSCGDRPFRPQPVVQAQISATISQFSQAVMHTTYIHSTPPKSNLWRPRRGGG
jgi:hypothetical protein